MNNTDTLKTIAAEIAAVEKQQSDVANLVAIRTGERDEIEAATAAAQSERDAAAAAMGGALVRAELGEAGADEVAAARAVMTQAEDALAKARARDGEVRDLTLTIAGLEHRQVEIAERVRVLRAKEREQRVRALVGDLHGRIGDYVESATGTIGCFVAVLALDDYLNEMGERQQVRPHDWGNAFLPGFLNHPHADRRPPSFADLMSNARAALIREHGGATLAPADVSQPAASDATAPATGRRPMVKPPASFAPGSVK